MTVLKRFMVIEMAIFLALITGLVAWRHSRSQSHFSAQSIVDDFVAVQPLPADLEALIQLLKGSGTGQFDVNRYFSILDALRPEEGYVLDWVYWFRSVGGTPVLYARPIGSRPFTNISEYVSSFIKVPGNIEQHIAAEYDNVLYRYLDRVHVEDSPRGFFQFAVLRLIGDRFLLHWHELYNETIMVCSKEGWEALVQEEKTRGDSYTPPPPEFIAAAQKIDFSPRIRKGSERVEVNVVTYNPFNGLDLHYLVIDRRFPHRIINHAQRNLLRHSQNFVF
jgi:hypothetical protein